MTILVNNAGVAHSTRAVDVTEEEWRHVVGTNLDAVFFWSQEGARRMIAAGKKGAVVNIASVLGFGVSKGTIAYATAKAGVIQMTKAFGNELAFKGVRVNAIAPGWFVTDINREYLEGPGAKITRDIPVGRFGQDGDLDGALLLLVSDAGGYMAGTTIVVDGGQMVALRGLAIRGRRHLQRGWSGAAPPPVVREHSGHHRDDERDHLGDSDARSTSAGPGQSPTRPQPSAEQIRPRRSAARRCRCRPARD